MLHFGFNIIFGAMHVGCSWDCLIFAKFGLDHNGNCCLLMFLLYYMKLAFCVVVHCFFFWLQMKSSYCKNGINKEYSVWILNMIDFGQIGEMCMLKKLILFGSFCPKSLIIAMCSAPFRYMIRIMGSKHYGSKCLLKGAMLFFLSKLGNCFLKIIRCFLLL